MSRADKIHHQQNVLGTDKDENVHLFAFANTRSGYEVVFSPEQPVIVLKSQRTTAAVVSSSVSGHTPPTRPQHPCTQWLPLSQLLFARQPNTTHAMYVADTTMLAGTPAETDEMVNGPQVGPLLRRLSNVMSKLNPHNGVLVAAGASAFLAFKFMLLGEKRYGHRDRLVQRLVLVSPVASTPRSSSSNCCHTVTGSSSINSMNDRNSNHTEMSTIESFRQLTMGVIRHRSAQTGGARVTRSGANTGRTSATTTTTTTAAAILSSSSLNAALAHRTHEGEYPAFELYLLLSQCDDSAVQRRQRWCDWLSTLQNEYGLISRYAVHLLEKRAAPASDPASLPSSSSSSVLFEAIAHAVGVPVSDGTRVNTAQRFREPRVYRIDFMLSRYTKTVVQVPTPSPLHTSGYDEAAAEESGVSENVCSNHRHCCTDDDEDRDEENGSDRNDANGTGHTHIHASGANSANKSDDAAAGEPSGHTSPRPHEESASDVEYEDESCEASNNHAHVVYTLQTLAHCDDDAVIYIEGRIASSLCRTSPAHTAKQKSTMSHPIENATECTSATAPSEDDTAADASPVMLLATTEGQVEVTGWQEHLTRDAALRHRIQQQQQQQLTTTARSRTLHSARLGAAIALEANLTRSALGECRLRVCAAHALTRPEVTQSFTVPATEADSPAHQLSRVRHSYGVLLIRGRKCVLVRSAPRSHVGLTHLLAAKEKHTKHTVSSYQITGTAKTTTSAPCNAKTRKATQGDNTVTKSVGNGTLYEERMYIPYATHSRSDETCTQCAIRALCEACDVSSDNFYLPSYLAPVTFYRRDQDDGDESGRESESEEDHNTTTGATMLTAEEKEGMCLGTRHGMTKRHTSNAMRSAGAVGTQNAGVSSVRIDGTGHEETLPGSPRCVTIYTALAVAPPPRGAAGDAVEDEPEYEEPYDWVSFARAQALLGAGTPEATALEDIRRQLSRAYAAGLYRPVCRGCGLFGELVLPKSGSSAGVHTNAARIAPASMASAAAAAFTDSAAHYSSAMCVHVLVVVCPAAPAQCASESVFAPGLQSSLREALQVRELIPLSSTSPEEQIRVVRAALLAQRSSEVSMGHREDNFRDAEMQALPSARPALLGGGSRAGAYDQNEHHKQGQRQPGEATIAFWLDKMVDVQQFCTETLAEVCGDGESVRASVVTILITRVVSFLACLTPTETQKSTGARECTRRRWDVLHTLISAARVSDALFVYDDEEDASNDAVHATGAESGDHLRTRSRLLANRICAYMASSHTDNNRDVDDRNPRRGMSVDANYRASDTMASAVCALLFLCTTRLQTGLDCYIGLRHRCHISAHSLSALYAFDQADRMEDNSTTTAIGATTYGDIDSTTASASLSVTSCLLHATDARLRRICLTSGAPLCSAAVRMLTRTGCLQDLCRDTLPHTALDLCDATHHTPCAGHFKDKSNNNQKNADTRDVSDEAMPNKSSVDAHWLPQQEEVCHLLYAEGEVWVGKHRDDTEAMTARRTSSSRRTRKAKESVLVHLSLDAAARALCVVEDDEENEGTSGDKKKQDNNSHRSVLTLWLWGTQQTVSTVEHRARGLFAQLQAMST